MEVIKDNNFESEANNMEGKILAAAEKLFLENSYAWTSTTQIAREVGCNQTLVHYYFRTKEKLFHAVLEQKTQKVVKELLSIDAGKGNFEDKLVRLIHYYYDTLKENSNIIMFLVNGLTWEPELFNTLMAEVEGISVRALSTFQKELEEEIFMKHIRPISIQQLMLNIVSMCSFATAIKPVFARLWGMNEEKIEMLLEERREEVVKAIILSIRPETDSLKISEK